METYTWLRAFADSWHLLFMFCFFIGVFIYILRPGASKVHDETANMIFRNDDKPESENYVTSAGRHSEPKEAR
ncbi:cbb3-type cytochrome c oxidase subunit 3 [Roseinatronobacter bogoriensis]|uniref:CcoQ/FixQ family Cbb3-type cytochrome c oxidase assembly chaperone n=1 Tax=Roseinatronobacter bogoriensis subsp. barguzinensis TaxID=441209 RepID=A0A2K8K6U2_9RHOB|nr:MULTISPECIES: cbb3-type cytochrome c oxidase subunit 3 [Rhodobaca]ATX65149.1 CcoQ/FixQ family Cbb3-type cytochrome c oxidase assembly chaperone [Rhodobaca barguzinensis]MBB4209643.1 cytochrome c oxidase cbb3-type subunit 4 [Rhodobaca bogoriensis DSM 18756]TDW35366.1 cytochrome c oxidase cbb3-type subunit 4 [Rhodobaca barguzinensis]TDY66576.1 cytochrome c oxidase cbb3-type subunit 4 [Rhodobaca bogoriensis DSM 18756]